MTAADVGKPAGKLVQEQVIPPKEYLGVACDERAHHRLQLVLAHLTMPDHDSSPGAQLANALGNPFDRLHPVVQEKNLPAADKFTLNRVTEEPLVVGAHDRFNGLPVGRRCFDKRHIPRSHQ